MKLLVGLGNPGREYSRHRHNVGFMAVDRIAKDHAIGPWRDKMNGEMATGRLATSQITLLKPQTYMNDSGRSVGLVMRYFKLTPADVVVFHDELDLAPGRIRAKVGGGHAGHNGLRSIQSHIGAEFARIRIGIGHPGSKDFVHAHVLHDFSSKDTSWLDELLQALSNSVSQLASGDLQAFTNQVARHRTTGKVQAELPQDDPVEEPVLNEKEGMLARLISRFS